MHGHDRSASHGYTGSANQAAKAPHPYWMKGARCIGGSTPLPLTSSGPAKMSHLRLPDKREVKLTVAGRCSLCFNVKSNATGKAGRTIARWQITKIARQIISAHLFWIGKPSV